MLETITQASIQDQFLALALSSSEGFSTFFRKYRELYPEEIKRACLLHLSEHGSDKSGRHMTSWLCLSADYLPTLLDPKFFSLEAAKRVAAILCQADQQYVAKLISLSDQSNNLSVNRLLSRALELIDVAPSKDTFIPWLRKLTNSRDLRICSKAVKALCELRPNRQLIERQLHSPDERVRANALEAIWHQQTPEAEDLLRQAADDESHRVAVNALVGLYLIGDKAAFDRLAALAQNPSQMLRRAMIWALGYIQDERGVAILQNLSQEDESPAVRSRAAKTLTLFPSADSKAVLPSPEETELPTTVLPTAESDLSGNVQPQFGDLKLTLLS